MFPVPHRRAPFWPLAGKSSRRYSNSICASDCGSTWRLLQQQFLKPTSSRGAVLRLSRKRVDDRISARLAAASDETAPTHWTSPNDRWPMRPPSKPAAPNPEHPHPASPDDEPNGKSPADKSVQNSSQASRFAGDRTCTNRLSRVSGNSVTMVLPSGKTPPRTHSDTKAPSFRRSSSETSATQRSKAKQSGTFLELFPR